MKHGDLVGPVTTVAVGLSVVGALAGTAVGGAPAGLGVGVGAVVALANFAWLARAAARAMAPAGRPPRAMAALLVAARHGLTFAALALPVAADWAHPAALGAGVTVLPLALAVHGFRIAREEP